MKTKTRSNPGPLSRTLFTSLLSIAAACLSVGTAWTADAQSDLFASVNGTAQNGGGLVIQYAPDGTHNTFVPNLNSPLGLDRPRGLVFDSSGNLFVTDYTFDPNSGNFQGSILKIAPDGTATPFPTNPAFPANFALLGLVTDGAGNLFVTAQANTFLSTTIYKVTPGGTLSPFGSVPGQGFGLAFDSAGNLYAASTLDTTSGNGNISNSNAIYKFTSEGVPSIFADSTKFSSLSGVIGLAFDGSGNLFVSIVVFIAESVPGDGDGEILKFAPDGTETTFATGLSTNPRGMAFDTVGNLFVADVPGTTTGEILKFTPGGTGTVFASGIGRTQGNGGPEFLVFPPEPVTPVTPVGSNVMVNSGTIGSANIALTFTQVTVGGMTTVTPIDPSSAGTLPSGFELTGSNLAFQITTTATYTPPIIIAFQMQPSVDPTTFSQLRVLHNEGGTLVDRTVLSGPFAPNPTTQTIYASMSSLSPFVIAKRSSAPQLTALGPAQVWLGLKNSDDVGTKFDLLAEALKNGTVIGSGQVNSVSGGSSGFNNAIQDVINMSLPSPTTFNPGDTLSFRLSVRIAATGHRSGTARLWFNDATANSRFSATIGGVVNTYYLRSGNALAPTAGSGPKTTIDVSVDRAVGGNPFKSFGTWNKSF